MILGRRAIAALVLSAAVFLIASCRSAQPGVAAASCDNASLTAHPALLVLAPHPDDETLGFAGLIDAYARAGKPVTVVVVTDGDAYCEACRFWKNGSVVTGAMCSGEELASFAAVRRSESESAAKILGGPTPRFLRYPDTGLAAALKSSAPLRRSDFSSCASCDACGYGEGAQTTLTADTLMASLRELIAEQPKGALIATTHWLDGHPDHAALGNFVRRVNGESASPHAIAYAVIHAHTKNTANADCWYPAPAAPDCPCMNEEARALADPQWLARNANARLQPSQPAALPSDAEYGEVKQLCLPDRLYAGDDAIKLRAVRAYESQRGRAKRADALTGIIDCNGYLTSFVRSTEQFVVINP
ncbi:MAG TPA: PIG-L family deacetylase [Thermoanaerobaculia bacterium]|nr:PIG-L family deacetylase [Thermoanaerobaculia bacterium]